MKILNLTCLIIMISSFQTVHANVSCEEAAYVVKAKMPYEFIRGEAEVKDVSKGTELCIGDIVITKKHGFVDLMFPNDSNKRFAVPSNKIFHLDSKILPEKGAKYLLKKRGLAGRLRGNKSSSSSTYQGQGMFEGYSKVFSFPVYIQLDLDLDLREEKSGEFVLKDSTGTVVYKAGVSQRIVIEEQHLQKLNSEYKWEIYINDELHEGTLVRVDSYKKEEVHDEMASIDKAIWLIGQGFVLDAFNLLLEEYNNNKDDKRIHRLIEMTYEVAVND